MNILCVAATNDNFGDTVISVCFNSLLKAALANIGVSSYQITNTPMKDVTAELIEMQDAIYFVGGGLVKFDYMTFYKQIDLITKIADEKNIPCIFSSVGVEGYDEDDEKCLTMKTALTRNCVKSITTRDDIASLEKYLIGTDILHSVVCDPACWTKDVYDVRINKQNKQNQIVGINVVRSGLFAANKLNWGKNNQINYLKSLKTLLDKHNIAYRFFTNGSFLDEHFLYHFKEVANLSDDQVVLNINNSRNLVQIISRFDAVISFRLHSAIIAYSLNIPSISLAWNKKVDFFYRLIGKESQSVPFEHWNGEYVFKILNNVLNEQEMPKHNEEYLLSVYQNIYNTLAEFVMFEPAADIKAYTFEEVKNHIRTNLEDLTPFNEHDTRVKMQLGQAHYLKCVKEREYRAKVDDVMKAVDAAGIKKYLDKINSLEGRTPVLKSKTTNKATEGLKDRVSALENRIVNMEQSNSWKLTKPLRLLGKALRQR